jgi:NTE family protein
MTRKFCSALGSRLAMVLALALTTLTPALVWSSPVTAPVPPPSPGKAPVPVPAVTALKPPVGAAGRTSRPRICLVLSGGGARGAAHVGVIKVLEELRVPIHCIAGTSMGAIVGGAYATGMSVPDMEQLVAGMTVEQLFKENPPRKEMAMRRKADDYKNYIGPEVGTSSTSATVGKGVITGVQLETVLRDLARVPGYFKFDELPIPYRAVATDLVTGKAVVFSEGDLPNVMRASMSVPGAVAPAEYNGMILVDGMLTSNLPVAAARAMGGDIVIAVNVGTPLLKREDLNGVLGVAGQMLSILTEQNVQASLAELKPTDILISPELGEFSTSDFDHLSSITPLGEVAARKVAERLASLSLPTAEYAALRRQQQRAMPTDTRPVDEIRFEKMANVNPQAAAAVMETQPGVPIERAVLDADMRRLYGTGDFEHVNYRILDEPGKRVLAVEAVEKAWGPDYLRLGMGLSSDFSGETHLALLATHRMTWLNRWGAELRTDAQVGFNNSLGMEFYQPLEAAGTYFIAPRIGIANDKRNVYSGSDRVAVYQINSRVAGIDVGRNFDKYGELRLGFEGGQVKPRLDTGLSTLDPGDVSFNHGALRARLLLDRLDSANFPRDGWRAGADIIDSRQGLGADRVYTKASFNLEFVRSVGENSFRLTAGGGAKLGSSNLPGWDQFQWGGFLRQSGYATGQLTGSSLAYGQLIAYRRVVRSGLLAGAYAGLSFELGRVGSPLLAGGPQGTLKSMALFVAYDTFAGPLYLGVGRAADQSTGLYFNLGRPF